MSNNEKIKQNLDLLRDPKFYLENLCKVKSKEHGLVPFKLNEAQKDLFNTLNESNRVIILKARQLGFSTGVTGYFYVDTIMNQGVTTALIGYNSDLVSELLDKIKTFYKSTPVEFRPTIQYNSKYEISFPKLDSKILVLPSTDDVGRGYTLNNVLCTELAFWTKAEEKMRALEQSVPFNGRIVIESTPNGQGNLYHRMWMKDNEYVKKEYGWWWGYSEEEIEVKRKGMDPRSFAQEYGLEFLAAGRAVFDIDTLKRQRRNILEPGDKNGDFEVLLEDGWKIYKAPEPGGLYVVGADVAEGVIGGDYSVAIIFDRKTGEEVAMWRGHASPDRFAEILDKKGRAYNNALLVVEINNHGLTTVTVLKQLMYPTMYFRPSKIETLSQTATDRLGWKTTKVTRPLLIDELNTATREDALIVHSKELLDEMSVFVYNDNNDMVPQEGFHDDCIFAAGIAYQGFKILYDKPLDQIDYRKHLPKTFTY